MNWNADLRSGAFLSVGAVYERVLSGCSVDCVYVYPELALSIAL